VKILITGGAGFIGYHLARELVGNGAKVDLIDNFSRGNADDDLKNLLEHPSTSLINADMLTNKVPCTDYDYIYHLAAIIGVSNVLNKPFDVLRYNVELTIKIIEWAKEQKSLSRLLFASTSEVYAGTLKHFSIEIPTPEDTALTITSLEHPRTSYMLSKIYGEALIIQSGLPYTIFRPHNIYGPRMGMAHVIPELLQKAYDLRHGESLPVFSPKHTRTFCYINDAVEMLIKMAETPGCQGEVLNLGQETNEISMKELAAMILGITEKDASIEEKEETSGSPVRRCPSMKKTKALLDIISSTDLEDGIMETYSWYNKHFS
jgi:nucleoside-diphosphate-sugar epimerase